MPVEIQTRHVFRCLCGKEYTQECVTQVGYSANQLLHPSVPHGWKVVGHFTVCPDEIIDIKITDRSGKRVWFENNDWMGE